MPNVRTPALIGLLFAGALASGLLHAQQDQSEQGGMMQGHGNMMGMMEQMNSMMERCNKMMDRMDQKDADQPQG